MQNQIAIVTIPVNSEVQLKVLLTSLACSELSYSVQRMKGKSFDYKTSKASGKKGNNQFSHDMPAPQIVLEKFQKGADFKIKEVEDLFNEKGFSRASASNVIYKLKKAGEIIRVGVGVYQRP